MTQSTSSFGYSGTPLCKKLGYKPRFRVLLDTPPDDYHNLIRPLPDEVEFLPTARKPIDMVHLFTTSARQLAIRLKRYRTLIEPDGMIWVSWPKRTAKMPTDVTEDVIRDLALPLGLVDVKVCAIDAVWSGLKLVIRKELRV